MSQQTAYAMIFLAIFLLLVLMAQGLYKLLKVSAETSRKFLHVSGGFLGLCLPRFFNSPLWVLVLCSLAFLLLSVTYINNWLPSIHHTRRKSIGSVVYPIPVYLCFLVASEKNNLLLFYLPISLLTISDTLAELGGRKWGEQWGTLMNRQKTVAGSLSFAMSALLISIAWAMTTNFSPQQITIMSVTITFIATTTEMVSTRGLDNITVPLSTLACLLLF
ncbi:MAG: diacylglycerol/polyprenol kinase family protein [Flavisolibacter sp.]